MACDFWVFGYGSLMWRPDFSYLDARLALLDGYHRSFCIKSRRWRGTCDRPGLVLGLEPGGCCHGVVFRVAAAMKEKVVDYLAERELSTYAYVARTLPVLAGHEVLPAYTVIADVAHPDYMPGLSRFDVARIIMEAEGVAGLNRDYLINTLRELEAHGLAEPELRDLLRLIEELTGVIESGSGI